MAETLERVIAADVYMTTVAPSEMRETRERLPQVFCDLDGAGDGELASRMQEAMSALQGSGVPIQGTRVLARMVFALSDQINRGVPVSTGTGSLFDPFTVPALVLILGTRESRQPHWRVKVADFFLSALIEAAETGEPALTSEEAVQMIRAASAPGHDFPDLLNGEVLMVVGLDVMAQTIRDIENIADTPEPWLSDSVMCAFVREFPNTRGTSRLRPFYEKARAR